MIRLVSFLALAGALALTAFWVYLRSELSVPGRLALASLRAAALVLLLALLFDVRLPWGAGRDAPRWALLDASASMSAAGGAAWRAALERARALEASGWTVVPFDSGVEARGLVGLEPVARRTELGPALARAVEAGSREVRVLSDLRFEDPVAAAAAVAAAPVSVTFEAFGGELRNAGLGALRVDDQTRRGDPVGADVEYFAEGASDSLQVEIREEGALVLSRAVPAPAPGRRGRARVELAAPRGEGRLRYTARVALAGDAFPADDEAVAYMMAGREEGGLVVVSLEPDWEARALLSALGDATGLPATGYLRAGPDRFVAMGRALRRGAPRDSSTVRAAAQGAALLVLHGLDARTDAWGRSLARRPARVVLWPRDPAGAQAAGFAVGPPRTGEWYASPGSRASALAGELAGAALLDLPPLSAVLPLDAGPAAGAPLEVQLGGTGPALPAFVLDASGPTRRVLVLASGFWRWSAREGAPRDAYRRLWSGVAGWLMAQDPGAAVSEVRPERWVWASGERVAWWVPAAGADTLRLEIRGADGAALLDTLLARTAGTSTRPLPPGTYGYRATSGGRLLGEGRLDVEARSDEMLPRPVAPALPPVPARGPGSGGAPGTPLGSGPWPWLLVLVLLSAEWVGRKRVGLR